MSEPFDPYYTWLGIPPEEQPPDLYRLLGIRRFESNLEVISNAGDQRMTHIRSFQTGKRAAHSQQLLNELSAASSCLLNPEKKGAYDRQLQQKDSPAVSKPVPNLLQAKPLSPKPVSAPNTSAGSSGDLGEQPGNSPIAVAATPKMVVSTPASQSGARVGGLPPQVRTLILAGISCAAVVLLGGVALWAAFGRGGSDNSPTKGTLASVHQSPTTAGGGHERPSTKSDSPETGVEKPAPDKRPKEPAQIGETPDAATPVGKPVEKKPPGSKPNTPAAVAAFPQPPTSGHALHMGPGGFVEIANTKGLLDATQAFTVELWTKLDPRATNHFIAGDRVDRARRPELSGDAAGWRFRLTSSDAANHKAALAGVGTESTISVRLADAPCHHLAICAEAGKLNAFIDGKFALAHDSDWSASPLNLHIGGDPYAKSGEAVGLFGDLLAVRVSKSCRYTKNFTPPAEFESDADTVSLLSGFPSTGSLLADRSKHNRAGSIRNGSLVPADGSLASTSSSAGAGPADVDIVPGTNPDGPQRPASSDDPRPFNPLDKPAPRIEKKVAPPEASAQQKARDELRKLFEQKLKKAVKPPEKLALCEELLTYAKDEKNPALRYALLEEARNLKFDAGDPGAAIEVVETMLAAFDVDPWATKSAALKRGAEAADNTDERRRLADAALKIAEGALAAARFEVASEAVAIASTAASRASDNKLKAAARALQISVDAGKKQNELAQLASERLKTDPENPKANLTWGKFLCFVKRDWKAGIPFLVKGDEEVLKAAAELDRQEPTDSDKQIAVGDAWYDLGQAASALEKNSLLLRAREWYQKGVGDTGGLTKRRVQTRIDEIAALLPKEIEAAAGGAKLPSGGTAGMIGRVTVDGRDPGLAVKYEPGAVMEQVKIAEMLAGYKVFGNNVQIEVNGRLHVPEQMTVVARQSGVPFVGASASLFVDGRKLGDVGERGDRDGLYRTDLAKGDYPVVWVVRGRNLGSGQISFVNAETDEPLVVYYTKQMSQVVHSVPTRGELAFPK